MKTHHFNLEFNIFHNLISNLSFHFPSCCIQTDFHLFIPINAIFLHLNALLSTCLICSHFLPQQSFSWLLFATIAPFLPIFFVFCLVLCQSCNLLLHFIFLFQPLWVSAVIRVQFLVCPLVSWVVFGWLYYFLFSTIVSSQWFPPHVSTPNICLEEYCFFNGAIYLFCKVLQTKDVQTWLTEMGDGRLLFLHS